MSNRASPPSTPLPRWLILLASIVIVFHLSAVGLRALAVPSGPWPTPQGPNTVAPPAFALDLYQWLPEHYLKVIQWPLSAPHNYHFPSNRPGQPAVSLEVHLQDAAGQELATVSIPDPAANFWVRHRQTLVANALGFDMPVTPPHQMEQVAAPGKQVKKVPVWEPKGPNRLQLEDVDENLLLEKVQRQPGLMQPPELTMLFLRSYVRYLCRTHGAARAEVVRHHHNGVPPSVLGDEPIPPGAFDDWLSNFGEIKP
jgi:hypothetical protein